MNIDYLRTYTFYDFVIFDWLATIITAAVISKFLPFGLITVLIILLITSIILHANAGIPTMTNYYLGISKIPYRVNKTTDSTDSIDSIDSSESE